MNSRLSLFFPTSLETGPGHKKPVPSYHGWDAQRDMLTKVIVQQWTSTLLASYGAALLIASRECPSCETTPGMSISLDSSRWLFLRQVPVQETAIDFRFCCHRSRNRLVHGYT